eukprot:CAMPEP_0172493290 /NCGR_PEP_ID=MMETSP1066-20121228/24696_1 /TAXON_ID=671091 /ORGANISM="Coscinodiscus wailesii, Strain CCMP2513" /LENGTH=95 /DNA_ID=CAMNT_0013263381 /DNA_START=202 /DNA_END=485 /DNA_ORIENTATION=-
MTLKQYLNRGGSRRLNEEHAKFTIKVDTKVSYLPVKTDTLDSLSVPDMTEKFTDQLGPVLQTFVQNMTSLESVVATTSSPTVSHAPSESHYPTIT